MADLIVHAKAEIQLTEGRRQGLPQRSYRNRNLQLALLFRAYLVARNRSPHTVRAYNQTLDDFFDFVASDDVTRIPPLTIRLYLQRLSDQEISAQTKQRAFQKAVDFIHRWATGQTVEKEFSFMPLEWATESYKLGPFFAELIYVHCRKLELKLFPQTESVQGEFVEARY